MRIPLIIASLTLLLAAPVHADPHTVFDIPRLDHITIDGDPTDWADAGFRIDLMTDQDGRVRRAADFNPRARLAWNADGLLLLVIIDDDTPNEHDYIRHLFLKDSVELFIAPSVGDPDNFMLLIAPGVDRRYPQPRHIFFDQRLDTPTPLPRNKTLQARIARQKTATGYTLEVLVPWSNLGLVAEPGLRLAFQLYAMDNDGDADQTYTATWFPAGDTHLNPASMYTLRLADQPSPPVRSTVRGDYRNLAVVTTPQAAGQPVAVLRNGRPLITGTLQTEDRIAAARFELPPPEGDQPLGALDVHVNGELIARTQRMGVGAVIGRALREAKLGFTQHVFTGRQFPRPEFQNPKPIKQLLGSCRLTVRYFDEQYREVTDAAQPGRYGAVVEAHVEHARTARRFFTLCRTPDDQPVRTLPVPYWAMPRMDEIRLPGGSTLKSQSPADAEAFTPAAAAMKLTALSRPTGSPVTPLDAAALDRQWWIGFMRRFYGIQSRPVIVQRGPLALAPTEPRHVLREGTPSEAGLSEEVIPAIEAVMTRWLTSNKGQGFAMCLARHDVVFFHRAYGRSFAGTPMTVHTPSRLTSLTKLITGLLLMTFVDQQAIDLDDDVTALLPALRRDLPAPAVPLTFRQLVTHTSGLAGHYGDELHDLAEVISDEYPYITRPVFHLYAGVGYAVAVDALETLTATPFPTLYERQLLKPLGCTDTIVPNSHEGALSTPLDLARVGVVLLHGSYGEHRFLSEANVQRMRPARLTMILGDDTQKTWGIGIWGSDASRGYSDSAFGHGGSSGASLRVDPTRDLIMSITCQEDRPYFDSSVRDEILKAIDAAVRK